MTTEIISAIVGATVRYVEEKSLQEYLSSFIYVTNNILNRYITMAIAILANPIVLKTLMQR